MPTSTAASALELEVLVLRAARLGRLDPYDLLEAYAQLEPSSHPELKNPRKLDLAAVVTALGGLPAAFVGAPRVMLVPRLDAFSHEPLPSPGARAGRLGDGTLLCEARFGKLSLMGVAAALCALTHELDKARNLLPMADEEAGADEGELGAFEPEETLVQIGGHRARAEQAPDDDTDEPLEEMDELEGTDEAEDLAPPRDLSVIAFTLGVDEAQLRAADAETGGALVEILTTDWELPEVLLHADLDESAQKKRAEHRQGRIVARLAEMGLAGRPLHVWVGPPALTDCLSPYSRELRQPMLSWAEAHPELVGEDVVLDTSALGEDLLYALTADFLATDGRLTDERLEADRSVGIQRYEIDGLPFELIDLGRVDASVIDARLTRWQVGDPAPVCLRLGPDLEDAGGGLATLLATLRDSLASVTVVLEATALEAPPGVVLVPDVMLTWAGEHAVAVPGANRGEEAELASLAEGVQVGGALLSIPHASLLSSPHVSGLAQRYKVRGIDLGGGAAVGVLADAIWAGMLGPDVELTWAAVATQYVRSGRPSVATLSGQTALAISRLRKISAASAPPPPPEPPRRERPRSGGGGRAVRIKA